MSNSAAPKLLTEFIGTFALVFIGAGAASIVGGAAGLGGITAVAFAHGLTLMIFICAYGSVSGGHMNPAVTVGVLAAGLRRGCRSAHLGEPLPIGSRHSRHRLPDSRPDRGKARH